MTEKECHLSHSPVTIVDPEESGFRGSPVSTEKAFHCPKELIDPTVTNTWGSSGVVRMGACVGTHELLTSDCLQSLTLGPAPLGKSLQYGLIDWMVEQ